jgi:2-amino-4-hydroxy-6-hydroxymethyldihydropteridine diphosphokinase
MPRVFLGLGSNIGNKEDYINKALMFISELYSIKKISHLYLTGPVGNIKQDWFLNCVIEIQTDADPKKLLSTVKSIERKLGRTKTVKNGPRTIDIDILFYGDYILIQDRLFVLQPMMDINPDLIHPVFKRSIHQLYHDHLWTEKVTRYK